tara:strand:- start:76 stop:420 length:345 start_codon:yes stop_codon:yes gene_type:complete
MTKKSKTKKPKYVARLCRVIDEGEIRYHQGHFYGESTNRLNELHQNDCPRVKELATLIDSLTNTLASGANCMSRRSIVNIAYEIIRMREKANKNIRKRMGNEPHEDLEGIVGWE